MHRKLSKNRHSKVFCSHGHTPVHRCSGIYYGHSSPDNQNQFFLSLEKRRHHNNHIQQISSSCVFEWTFHFFLLPECCVSILDCLLYLGIYALIRSNVSCYRTDLHCTQAVNKRKWQKEWKKKWKWKFKKKLNSLLSLLPRESKVWLNAFLDKKRTLDFQA